MKNCENITIAQLFHYDDQLQDRIFDNCALQIQTQFSAENVNKFSKQFYSREKQVDSENKAIQKKIESRSYYEGRQTPKARF